MSGIFSSMNTATKGLMAQQTALHTTGHNIANVNTEGFTRQRVDMQADRAFNLAGVGQLGTGVRMQSVVRMINDHVSKQIRTENSTLSRFTEKSAVTDQLEVIFNEPSDTGLNFNIGEMFKAFNELSNNPESLNAKTVTVEKLKTLTETLNHMARQIVALETETHDAIDKNVVDFNSKIDGLNTLNKQIFNVAIKGQIPNDLLDQRDMMLKDLTAIADVDIDLTDKYGRVGIEMDDKKILTQGGEQNKLKYDSTNKKIGLLDKEDNTITTDVSITNGKIRGNMDALEDIKEARGNLDDLANTMANAMNNVHKKYNISNEDIFVNTNAIDIEVNENIRNDPNKLQAGQIATGQGGYLEGDGSLALELSQLKSVKLKEDGTIPTDGTGNTIGGHYRDIVIKIGISKQHSDNMIDNQEVLTRQLENRRESVSGVSINDEITNVIKFQKAYEANAKVLSVLTDMLDVLINRTGV